MHLVIVESPTKAKTIRKFLGSDYQVLASMGHIRDLPESAADVPEQYKKTPKGKLGVDPANDFDPLYVVSSRKSKTVSELKAAMKNATDLYLATDEDREGESISWHLLEVLKPKVPVHRMVFHEITRNAIESALQHPRALDENLVHAQETRRILDRLVGYTISPILWKKIAFGLSAGRVQSAVLKAVVDRERERMRFVKSNYWDVVAQLEKDQISFEAKLSASQGKRIAIGKDFDEATGKLKADSNILLLDETLAKRVAEESQTATWNVTDVTEKPVTRRPPAPFITSSLQQEANRKLGLSSKETMKLAQSLYEQGYITYMRTDSTALSPEATTAIRSFIDQRFGKEYLPSAVREYAATAKGAQEAHEAIRPSLNFTPPNETDLTSSQKDLYELIWMRALASQMEDSKQLQITATIEAGEHLYTASGMKILFPGFLRAYVEGSEDADQALSDKERILPSLANGDHPTCQKTEALSHETKPPARFTEAGLVQFMEKEGIGRPSTYAATISTLIDRKYVRKGNGALVPTFTGFAVTQYMETRFGHLVDIGFTSEMEQNLDQIANGKQEWIPYLKNFYFGEHGLEKKVEEESKKKDSEEESARTMTFPIAPDIKIHIGRFGPYIEGMNPKSQTSAKASLPEDLSPSDLTQEKVEELLSAPQQGPTSLGIDPETGKYILLKTGAYGPYLQLGEDDEDNKIKPKRVSIPKTISLETLNEAKAIAILSLPRLVGVHPTSGKEIRAGIGRFGPYVVHDGDFRSLKAEDDLFTISLERSLELLAEPKGTRRGAAAVLRTLGAHPKDNKPVTLHQGKFGPYVKHGATNATVPKTESLDTLTLDRAIELLNERKAKGKTTRKKSAKVAE